MVCRELSEDRGVISQRRTCLVMTQCTSSSQKMQARPRSLVRRVGAIGQDIKRGVVTRLSVERSDTLFRLGWGRGEGSVETVQWTGNGPLPNSRE